jgi:hypothetical protein
MKRSFFHKSLPYALFLYSSLSLGAVPITVTFNSGTTSFASNSSGTANYVVAVKGIVPSNAFLTFKSSPNSSKGLTASQVSTGPSLCSGVNTVCSSPTFSLKANQSCCLQYALTSSNQGSYTLQPEVSSTPVNTYRARALSSSSITVSGVASNTPLTATPATLALAVNCPSATAGCAYTNAALSGNSRLITIKNTSTTDTTTPLTVTPASFAPGTQITTDNCTGATLSPLGECTITIKPGAEASYDASNTACTGGTQPNPGTVTVTATSAPAAASSNVYVLSYGCIYQEGYVYAVDDSYSNYPNTGSVGGNVVNRNDDTTNQLNLPWDSSDDCVNNGICTDVPTANNTLNGSGNTAAIVTALTGKPGVSPANYPAGYCTTYTIDSTGTTPCPTPSSPTCYKSWYSPAICEVGPSGLAGSGAGASCPASTQNLYSQLFLNGKGQFASNAYWSSTQSSTDFAWNQNFLVGGQYSNDNLSPGIGVRCVRALTP